MHAGLMMILLAGSQPMPAAVQQSGITEQDWRKLAAGEIVIKSTPSTRENPHSSAEGALVIKVPWRHAFEQIGRHEEMLESSSCMKAMEVILQATRDGKTLVKARETHQSLWMKATYTLDYIARSRQAPDPLASRPHRAE